MYIKQHTSVVVKQCTLTETRLIPICSISELDQKRTRPRNHLDQVIEKSELLHVNTVPPG